MVPAAGGGPVEEEAEDGHANGTPSWVATFFPVARPGERVPEGRVTGWHGQQADIAPHPALRATFPHRRSSGFPILTDKGLTATAADLGSSANGPDAAKTSRFSLEPSPPNCAFCPKGEPPHRWEDSGAGATPARQNPLWPDSG